MSVRHIWDMAGEIKLAWFSKIRANSGFLHEFVKRASRIDEVEIDIRPILCKWDGKTDAYVSIVKNKRGQKFTVLITKGMRKMFCNCPDFKYRCTTRDGKYCLFPCKHILAVVREIVRGNVLA